MIFCPGEALNSFRLVSLTALDSRFRTVFSEERKDLFYFSARVFPVPSLGPLRRAMEGELCPDGASSKRGPAAGKWSGVEEDI